MNFVDYLRPEDVVDAETCAEYVRQTCGTLFCSGVDMAIFKRQLKAFFKEQPNASWYTLCRTAQWARSKKKRLVKVYTIIPMVSWAWAAGALPELDGTRRDEEVEARISEALAVERDPEWRYRLIGAEGVNARREVLIQWARSSASR